jgi:cyclopropane-fatty-acyl-phospholipid synthase
MKQGIYFASLEHSRLYPVKHDFKRRLLFFIFDLDKISDLSRKNFLFGYNKRNLFFIKDKNYLDEKDLSLKSKISLFLKNSGFEKPVNKIYFATSCGYFFKNVFNPVSFYFCFDDKDNFVCAAAEVNNTFGERHLYILDVTEEDGFFKATSDKAFHVSPFNKIEGKYNFYFGIRDDSFSVKIEVEKDLKPFFYTELKENQRLDFSDKNLFKAILKFHIIPHLTKPAIYKEAFKLFFVKKLKYNDKPVAKNEMTIKKAPYSAFQKVSKFLFLKRLSFFKNGNIDIYLPGKESFKKGNFAQQKNADLYIYDYSFFGDVLKKRDIGLGEAYMNSVFETDDLTSLIRFFILNTSVSSKRFSISLYLKYYLRKLFGRDNPNSLIGSRKNISKHYDLNNEFFSLFLDENMIYSSGISLQKDDDLYTSQINKMDALIKKAKINKNDHVLEIGCGWGGFAVYAAKKTGCKLTAVTISQEQYDYAVEKVKNENLEDRINIVLTDYRKIKGEFDKIVSIEMIEAVGEKYTSKYFKKIDSLLKKDGIAVIQGITVPDQEYFTYKYKYDWIQKHIFPGGHLLSVTEISKRLSSKTGLIIENLENIGPHYAKTLRQWDENFTKNLDKIKALGFDDIFIRKWKFYLNSCEALFEARGAENIQIVLTRPYNKFLINNERSFFSG